MCPLPCAVCEHKSASGHFVLAVDPTVSCFSDSHWVMMVLFGFPFFGTLLGLPAWLLLQVKRIEVHKGHQAKKHERCGQRSPFTPSYRVACCMSPSGVVQVPALEGDGVRVRPEF